MKTSKMENPHSLSISIVFDGLLVGIFAGCIAVIYRILLNHAESLLFRIIDFTKGNAFYIAGWFAVLIILGLIVGRLVKWDEMCSGSGIPQVQGEMKGYISQNWVSVLITKITGGTLSILGGLSLGREGPSVQLGAMAAKGLAKITGKSKTKERIMEVCGSGAGLAAAFNAPLAGIMFALEEIQKNFNSSMLVCVTAGALTSDFISKNVFGLSPVFEFQLKSALPLKYYGLLILLGIILGAAGALYNCVMLKGQDIYKKLSFLKPEYRTVIPFLVSGVLCYCLPSVLAGGHAMITRLESGHLLIGSMVLLLLGKFLFSAVSFGSGAPGGIFFPLLILGAYIGSIYGTSVTGLTGISQDYIINFIILAMAGFFTAIVRAPITGVILIADLLKSEPIYESLLGRILAKKGLKTTDAAEGKVLSSFVVGTTCLAVGKKIKDVAWPEHCLIVTISRGKEEIIAKGSTVVHSGDTLVVLVEEDYLGMVTESFQLICGEITAG